MPNFQKNEHFLPPDTYTYMCVSGGKKCSFFGKFGLLCFLETPVLRFALLSIAVKLSGNFYELYCYVSNCICNDQFLANFEMLPTFSFLWNMSNINIVFSRIYILKTTKTAIRIYTRGVYTCFKLQINSPSNCKYNKIIYVKL